MNVVLSSQTKLEDWKARLSTSSKLHFGNQTKYFVERLQGDLLYNNILLKAVHRYPLQESILNSFEIQLDERKVLQFDCEEHEAAFAYQFLNYLIQKVGYEKLNELIIFQGRDFTDTHHKIIEQLITPQINFLNDQIEKEGSTLFLFEKYKFRCECFTKDLLVNKYDKAKANYEQILEDDLRLYLFDQGINYPFSTPKSSSGRVDIVSNIDTSDPLIAEIKIFDRKKSYGVNRIQSGFTQIIKYATDYNKNVGYLIVFNMEEIELHFNLDNDILSPFPYINFNQKIIYFITVNCYRPQSASNIGKLKSVTIDKTTLIH